MASASSSVVPLAILGAKLSYKLAKHWWMREPKIEGVTRRVLQELDECDMGVEAADEVMEVASTELVVNLEVALAAPVNQRRRARKSVAASYALQTYLKYGDRPKTAANVLITRKYISDLLLEKKSLRLRDKVELMDLAVFLSFVPTQTKLQCNAMMNTKAYAERVFSEWQTE
jgi:hypothetical protein